MSEEVIINGVTYIWVEGYKGVDKNMQGARLAQLGATQCVWAVHGGIDDAFYSQFIGAGALSLPRQPVLVAVISGGSTVVRGLPASSPHVVPLPCSLVAAVDPGGGLCRLVIQLPHALVPGAGGQGWVAGGRLPLE